MNWFKAPRRDIAIAVLTVLTLAGNFVAPKIIAPLIIGAAIGALPAIWAALKGIRKLRITIDVFNAFALVISFVTLEWRSAGFIVLMLAFARILDWRTESRAHRAVEELLKLKPERATREVDSRVEDVDVTELKVGDIVVGHMGTRVAVDGTVTFGEAFVNEASITGESVPVRKVIGDAIFGGTLVETGTIKYRADRVGKDSTVERIAALIEQAASHKSRSQNLADRFAMYFLPIVGAIGLGVYLVTHNASMTAALFLVACADDMAVAIPLAITAALGQAAKRGVVIKGGQWIETLAKIQTVVLDKTGTLTYGKFVVDDVVLAPAWKDHASTWWRHVGVVEKYSNHPIGKAIFEAASLKVPSIPDPENLRVIAGGGIAAQIDDTIVIIGNEVALKAEHLKLPAEIEQQWKQIRQTSSKTAVAVMINRTFAGFISVGDVPRPEARRSLDRMRTLGVKHFIMFTGDTAVVAQRVAKELGITDVQAMMKPEDKVRDVARLKDHPVAMIGDGTNDAPALARADVGIAMGTTGTAVAVEAADVVILTDNLSRVPETMELSRRTMNVVRGDMVIWLLSNVVGFALVLTGIAGPALAAFYNFITDFFPLINSARLFRARKEKSA